MEQAQSNVVAAMLVLSTTSILASAYQPVIVPLDVYILPILMGGCGYGGPVTGTEGQLRVRRASCGYGGPVAGTTVVYCLACRFVAERQPEHIFGGIFVSSSQVELIGVDPESVLPYFPTILTYALVHSNSQDPFVRRTIQHVLVRLMCALADVSTCTHPRMRTQFAPAPCSHPHGTANCKELR
jgi:hypothetical protein